MCILVEILSQLIVLWDKYDFALEWEGNTLGLAANGDGDAVKRRRRYRGRIRRRYEIG